MVIRDTSVVFKGRKDGITILIDPSVDFERIKRVLADKLGDARKFFGEAKSPVFFTGRDLSEDEENELLSIIFEKTGLDVPFISNEPERLVSPSRSTVEKLMTNAGSPKENMTYFYSSGLRSGQSINYDGSVVVIGDVKDGAEIIASGNVIIMGTLSGLVHGGCLGNDQCFVCAMNFQPSQIRIADVFAMIPQEERRRDKFQPAYAYVEGKKMFIEPLME